MRNLHLLWSHFNHRWRFLLALLAALFFLLSPLIMSPSQGAVVVPSPDSGFYVLDQAGVLSSETKSMIISTSTELQRMTKAQVAVVTLKSLDDQPISDVSLAIARQWQLGDKALNNGLLMLVVPSGTPGNRSRIEVGYGLEGALPDAKTGRIQDQYIVPAFNTGQFDQGIRDGYLAVVAEIAREYGVTLTAPPGSIPAPTNFPVGQEVPTWAVVLGVLGLMVLLWLDNRFLNGFITGMLIGMLFRGGGRGGGGASGGGGGFGGGGSSR